MSNRTQIEELEQKRKLKRKREQNLTEQAERNLSRIKGYTKNKKQAKKIGKRLSLHFGSLRETPDEGEKNNQAVKNALNRIARNQGR